MTTKEKYRKVEEYMTNKNFTLYKYQKKGIDWLLKKGILGFKTKDSTSFGGPL